MKLRPELDVGTGSAGQFVECLPSIQEALDSTPSPS